MSFSRNPWTPEELDRLLPKVVLDDMPTTAAGLEAEAPATARPLPPMTREEAQDLFWRLMNIAHERPLTTEECFLHGQLVHVYSQACYAFALGYKGRFFVLPEEVVRAQQEEDRRAREVHK